jgi:hypothetical protein
VVLKARKGIPKEIRTLRNRAPVAKISGDREALLDPNTGAGRIFPIEGDYPHVEQAEADSLGILQLSELVEALFGEQLEALDVPVVRATWAMPQSALATPRSSPVSRYNVRLSP